MVSRLFPNQSSDVSKYVIVRVWCSCDRQYFTDNATPLIRKVVKWASWGKTRQPFFFLSLDITS
ncbi:hypothetical protein HanPI659440_Chr13g0509011 [Helianthus annuus]|nr:hypothetical protein HanPI659440_Chr13g0509011 [Helianthus annuus]